ncbi:hypothetical protein ACFL3V_02850 [Nanoarchaeota archaeon]
MSGGIPKPIREDVLRILKKAQRFINSKDSKKLKNLSDQTIHNTTIFQDTDSLQIAVVVYAISKLLERWGYEGEYADETRKYLGSAQFLLEKDKLEEYRGEMKRLVEFISTSEKDYKLYVEKVIDKAQIKKGSRIYEHGISAARVADLLGIGQWELMSYIGKTRIHDDVGELSGVEQRLKFARSLFGAK